MSVKKKIQSTLACENLKSAYTDLRHDDEYSNSTMGGFLKNGALLLIQM